MSNPLCLRCRAALRNSIQSHPRLLCPQQQRAYQSNKVPLTRRISTGPEDYRCLPGVSVRSSPSELSSTKATASTTPNTTSTSNRAKKGFRVIRKVKTIPAQDQDTFEDPIDKALAKPTWSVRSLLPSPEGSGKQTPTITPSQLHHLLRLSALPPPSSPKEESTMLRTLESQLHFVREIQSVDTTGVEPLQAIRDETEEGVREITIGLEALKDALGNERVVGRHKRPRRWREEEVVQGSGKAGTPKDMNSEEDWDVMGMAERKVGKYFVVDSSGVGRAKGKIGAS